MGRYDSHKFPFHYQMNSWVNKRINTRQERQAKSMPCHVVKVDKDFITVAFENQNGIFTPPTVKIPQSWSQYSREPTQVGDKGYAVPGNYYLGGVTGDAGGNTDFYPRGNLTTLSFNGVSHTQNPSRDYDQLTHMGGPNGWIVGPFQSQQQQSQQQNGQSADSASIASMFRPSTFIQAQQSARQSLGISPSATIDIFNNTSTSSSNSTQSNGTQSSQSNGQQNNDQTQFSFDKNKKATVQSTDSEHAMVVDQQNDHAHLSVTSGGKAYIGGDGQKGTYAKVYTEQGLSINTFARIG